MRTGVAGLLSLEANVAFKLANSSSDVTKRIDLRWGVTGTGAAIWLGIMLVLLQNVSFYIGEVCAMELRGLGHDRCLYRNGGY